LLSARGRQLERHEVDISDAIHSLEEERAASKRRHDSSLRAGPDHSSLCIGDLVLLHNTTIKKSHSVKLCSRWTRPFKIIDVKECYGTYCFAKLDGSVLKDYQDGSHLKHFYTRPLLSADDLGSGVEPLATDDDVPMDDVWEVFDVLDE
jgi:hypothetical protein